MNEATQTAENLYYRDIDASNAEPSRRDQHSTPPTDSRSIASPDQSAEAEQQKAKAEPRSGVPPYLFSTAESLVKYCREHNLTIAQVVWENELAFRSEEQIREGLFKCAC